MILQDEDSWSEPHCWRAVQERARVCVHARVCAGPPNKREEGWGGCQTKVPPPLTRLLRGRWEFSHIQVILMQKREKVSFRHFTETSAKLEDFIYKSSERFMS